MEILNKELGCLYQACLDGKANPLEPLSIQYADYAQWQRNWLSGEHLVKQMGYWKRQLADLPSLATIPSDFSRPTRQTFKGKGFKYQIGSSLAKKIKLVNSRHALTSFMLLQSTLAILASRYSGKSDIVIGSPVAGRDYAEIEPLIGFFVNSLVLRSDLSSNPTLTDFLSSNKRMILDAFSHQHIPFEMLVEELSPTRSLQHNSLFQLLFAFQKQADSDLALIDTEIQEGELLCNHESDLMGTTTRVDLELHATESETKTELLWIYNESLFEEGTIRLFGQRYELLLEQLVDALLDKNDKAIRLDELSIISPSAKQDIVSKSLKTAKFESVISLSQLFERQVETSSVLPALEYGETLVSYKELNARANQLAHYLIERGIQPGAKVALQMHRSINMIVALIGVLKTGATYVPIDMDVPSARLTRILSDCQASSLLTDTEFSVDSNIRSDYLLNMECLEFQSALKNYSTSNVEKLSRPLVAQDLAYIIYTSGSTGVPKGVMVSHENIVNYLTQTKTLMTRELNMSVFSSSLAFDASVCAIFYPLLNGKSIRILPESKVAISALTDEILSTPGEKLFKLTPSHLRAILDLRVHHQANKAKHLFLLGGEQLEPSLVAQWKEIFPKAKFINQYGPTETTVGASIYCVERMALESNNLPRIPIGTMVGNAQLLVLDELMGVVPQGIQGELFIGGIGVSQGYLNQPSLTAERFLPNPFSAKPGERVYRSGDRVNLQADGNFEFIERMDNQVKLRGYRIELEEIEKQVMSVEGIESCVVLHRKTQTPIGESSTSELIVAYYRLHANFESSEAASHTKSRLLQSLKLLLPEYMVPTAYVELKEWPLTTNGKLNKAALPAPGFTKTGKIKQEKPNSPESKLMIGIWSELLAIEPDNIDITQNFFSLGGHSLLATRLISAIRMQLGVEVPLKAIFEFPTIQLLTENLPNYSAKLKLPVIEKSKLVGDIPLSYAQRRLWFIDQMDQGSAQYNMPGHYLIEGEFDSSAFNKSLKILINRHDALRTVYKELDCGEPTQVIKKSFKLPLEISDISDLNPSLQQTEIERVMKKEAQTPFDLTCDLMVRVRILKLEEQSHLLLYTLHHIASDGWSMAIFRNELNALYQAQITNVEPSLSKNMVRYADYSVWQREVLDQHRLNHETSYWLSQLDGIPELHGLPLDKSRPKKQGYSGIGTNRKLSASVTHQIKQLSEKYGVTPFIFLETVFALLIGRYSGETDIVVGTPIAGRMQSEVEGIIGLFVNSLVIRTHLNRDLSFEQLLKENRETILEAYEHQHLPFEMLVENLKITRNIGFNPVFQIMFGIQNNEQMDLDMGVKEVSPVKPIDEPVSTYSTTTHVDLEVNVREVAEQFHISWTFSEAIFSANTALRMSAHYECLLESILRLLVSEQGDLSVQDISLVTETEKSRIALWNSKKVEEDTSWFVHERFEQQAKSKPKADALIFGENRLSYAQLNTSANQLAHHLIQQVVAPGVCVGICIERSFEMIIGILAILKAGGTYVPIAPDFPKNRIKKILSESGAKLILVHNLAFDDSSMDSCKVVNLLDDAVKHEVENSPKKNPVVESLSQDHIAYIIYTSGSTGTPKGVMVSHRNLSNYLSDANTLLNHSLVGSVMSSSLVFDATVGSLYSPLCVGKSISLVEEGALSLESLSRYILSSVEGYLFKLTPSHLKALLNDGSITQSQKSKHVFIIGGESLSLELSKQWLSNLPGCQLINEYGPTETTVGCSTYACGSETITELTGATLPIGVPMKNVKLYVANDSLILEPTGIAGELYIGGLGVSAGYKNQAALTAERFIPNPFGNSGERLYRSGDRVKMLDSNLLEFIERVDNQVKIRGYRIELGEIESQLLRQERVADCAIIPFNNNQHLCAYLVMEENEKFRCVDDSSQSEVLEQIKSSIRTMLPAYMQPHSYIVLNELPLNVNGKLDRKSLPHPIQDSVEEESLPVGNGIEQQLADIWSSLLDIDNSKIRF